MIWYPCAMTTVTPYRFKDRGHFTKRGEPKRALTAQQARQVLADNPDLNMYICDVCEQCHVGNRERIRLTERGGRMLKR